MDDKVLRILKPLIFEESFKNSITLPIDNLLPSWLERRESLINNSKEYLNFLDQLKREHAIETGIVERMYDLDKGITETLIKKGFVESYISHSETNIPVPQLFKHL